MSIDGIKSVGWAVISPWYQGCRNVQEAIPELFKKKVEGAEGEAAPSLKGRVAHLMMATVLFFLPIFNYAIVAALKYSESSYVFDRKSSDEVIDERLPGPNDPPVDGPVNRDLENEEVRGEEVHDNDDREEAVEDRRPILELVKENIDQVKDQVGEALRISADRVLGAGESLVAVFHTEEPPVRSTEDELLEEERVDIAARRERILAGNGFNTRPPEEGADGAPRRVLVPGAPPRRKAPVIESVRKHGLEAGAMSALNTVEASTTNALNTVSGAFGNLFGAMGEGLARTSGRIE